MRMLCLLAGLALALAAQLAAQSDMPTGTRYIADSGTQEYFPLS